MQFREKREKLNSKNKHCENLYGYASYGEFYEFTFVE